MRTNDCLTIMPDMFFKGDSQLKNDQASDSSGPLQFPNMPWEVLSAMIEGKSSIDLTAMPVYSRDEAIELLDSYGFDLNQASDRAELEGYLVEAVHFIEHRFLSRATDWESLGAPLPPTDHIPKAVTGSHDVVDLMLLAAQHDHPYRAWACALLKVMHTLVYIQNSPLYKYHAQASESILSRFLDVIKTEEDGSIFLNGQQRKLGLYAFEAKHYKPRESILIKLLCKKENVAENVWDLVGVRLVTFHTAQAILAVDILREQKILLFPNVIPSRSRNTLINFNHFRELYEEKRQEAEEGKISWSMLNTLFETGDFIPPDPGASPSNPLSSPQYRSLHITCRQLLRIPSADPMTGSGSLRRNQTFDSRFAFPYEIQILDKDGYLENRTGHGAHISYKRRQLVAARQRVLGTLLK